MEELEEKLSQVRQACGRRLECRDLMDFVKLALFVVDHSEEDDLGVDISFDDRILAASEILALVRRTAWDLKEDLVFFYAVVLYARTLVWMNRMDELQGLDKEIADLPRVGRVAGFEWVLEELEEMKGGRSMGKWVFEFDVCEWIGIGVGVGVGNSEGFDRGGGFRKFENKLEKILKR